jgi:hypothetical protein
MRASSIIISDIYKTMEGGVNLDIIYSFLKEKSHSQHIPMFNVMQKTVLTSQLIDRYTFCMFVLE